MAGSTRPSLILFAMLMLSTTTTAGISRGPMEETAEVWHHATVPSTFFDRLVNSFTGNVGLLHPGLTTDETIAVILVAFIVLILPCCCCFSICCSACGSGDRGAERGEVTIVQVPSVVVQKEEV